MTFANLLKFAMAEGLGRPALEVNTKWNPDSLSNAVKGGFSPEAVRKWLNGNVIPNEQNVKQIISVLTAGEPYHQKWFDCFSQTSSNQRKLSRSPREEITKKFSGVTGTKETITTVIEQEHNGEQSVQKLPLDTYTSKYSQTDYRTRGAPLSKPVLMLMGNSRWNSEKLANRPSCAATKMFILDHFLHCEEVLTRDVIDLFNFHEDSSSLLGQVKVEMHRCFRSGHKRDTWLFIFGHGIKDEIGVDLLFPLSGYSPDSSSNTTFFRFSDLFEIVSKIATGNVYIVVDACCSGQAIEYIKYVGHDRLRSSKRGVVLLCAAGITNFVMNEPGSYRLNLFGKLMLRSVNSLASNAGASRITLNRFVKEIYKQAEHFMSENSRNKEIYHSFSLSGGLQHWPLHGKILNIPALPLRNESQKHYCSGVFGYKYM